MTEIILENDFLECAVCLETFDDTCKMLPCQHTFHKRCLLKIFSVDERLECPQCRQLVKEDIETLPRNYFLLSVLEKARPKSSENEDRESLHLKYAFEKSKSEAEVKEREEYLLSQKEQLEYELMLLKSEREEVVANPQPELRHSSSSTSYSVYTSESDVKENDCSTPCKYPAQQGGIAAGELVDDFEALNLDDLFESPPKDKSQPLTNTDRCISLEKQVTDGFDALNMNEMHPSLTEKLLEIVKAVTHETQLQRIELMHLINYDDLIGNYLNLLENQLSENSFPAADPSATTTAHMTANTCVNSTGLSSNPFVASADATSCSDSSCAADVFGVSRTSGAGTGTVPVRCVLGVEDYDSYSFDDGKKPTEAKPLAAARACEVSQSLRPSVPVGASAGYAPIQSIRYDERNLTYAIELSRQLTVTKEPDEMIEEVLQKSKIAFAIDQQRAIFLDVREKVELQIALLMSEI